jgi:hypothetical protein
MVLEPGGRIMFLFTRSNRQPPTDDAERAELFRELGAYTGRVRLDGLDRLITTVDLSSHPGWGGDQLRFFTLDGDRLTIRTPEQTIPPFRADYWSANSFGSAKPRQGRPSNLGSPAETVGGSG